MSSPVERGAGPKLFQFQVESSPEARTPQLESVQKDCGSCVIADVKGLVSGAWGAAVVKDVVEKFRNGCSIGCK